MRLKREKETKQVEQTTFRLPLKWRKELEKVEPQAEFPKTYLQETPPKKSKKFPLAEVMVVIGILDIFINFWIGMVSCACPSWDMACKTRYEIMRVKSLIISGNKSQQTYYIEKGSFAHNNNKMLYRRDDKYYSYSISTTDTSAFIFATPQASYNESVYIFPFGELHFDVKSELKSWVGGVFVSNDFGEKTVTIICEANSHSTNSPATPTYKNGKIACGAGTKEYRYQRLSSS
jgi:type IV pilus assembly protein PilA